MKIVTEDIQFFVGESGSYACGGAYWCIADERAEFVAEGEVGEVVACGECGTEGRLAGAGGACEIVRMAE